MAHTLRWRLLGAAIPAVALCIPLGAAAQELEEIIVTARKRAESLLEAPLSITVFSAEDLSKAGLQTLGDIALQTTGLAFQDNLASNRPGRLNTVIRFRGMSPPDGKPHLQLAGLFVDGVYVMGGSQSIPLLDVERVEVIKGPQSAFFGRNTFSGAINYVTRNPSLTEFSGKVRASAAQFDQTSIAAILGGPLVENRLGYQVSLNRYNKGAMYIASDGGGLGKESSQSAGLTLYATPTDNFSGRLRVFYHEDDDGPPAIAYLPGSDYDTCSGTTISRPDNAGRIVTLSPKNYICGQVPNPGQAGAPAVSLNTSLYPAILARIGQLPYVTKCPNNDCSNWLVENLVERTSLAGVPSRRTMGMSREIVRASLDLDYGLANGMALSLSVSYNDHGVNWIRDFDATDAEVFYASDPQSNDDKGGELRLSSSPDSRISWLVGASYYESEIALSGVGGDVVIPCFDTEAAGCSWVVPGRVLVPAPLFRALPTTGGEVAKVRGIFAAATVPLGEQFSLDLEARYMADQRITTGISADYNEILPRIILRWQPNDAVNLYASLSRGMLPGVLNTQLINAVRDDFTQPFIDRDTQQPSTESEYDQIRRKAPDATESTPTQQLDAIELGIKASVWGGRGQINAAAYYYKWTAQVFQNFVVFYRDVNTSNPSDVPDGIPNEEPNTLEFKFPGDSNLWGIELESSWTMSDNWMLGANVAWHGNEYTTFAATFVEDITGSRNLAGNQSGRYPELMGNANLTYTDSLTGNWDFFARGDFMYSGKSWAGLGGNLAYMEGYWLTNLRAGVERDDLRVELFVNNAFEQDTWAGGTRYVDFTKFTRFNFNIHGVLVAPQDLRTIGIQVDWSF